MCVCVPRPHVSVLSVMSAASGPTPWRVAAALCAIANESAECVNGLIARHAACGNRSPIPNTNPMDIHLTQLETSYRAISVYQAFFEEVADRVNGVQVTEDGAYPDADTQPPSNRAIAALISTTSHGDPGASMIACAPVDAVFVLPHAVPGIPSRAALGVRCAADADRWVVIPAEHVCIGSAERVLKHADLASARPLHKICAEAHVVGILRPTGGRVPVCQAAAMAAYAYDEAVLCAAVATSTPGVCAVVSDAYTWFSVGRPPVPRAAQGNTINGIRTPVFALIDRTDLLIERDFVVSDACRGIIMALKRPR